MHINFSGLQSAYLLLLVLYVWKCHGHGQIFEPSSRSSLWRFGEFQNQDPPVNYDDIEIYCGGAGVQHGQNGGRCGVCGDRWDAPVPRDNEDGGIYDSKIIARNYTVGQVAHIKIYMDKAHLGYFEIRLCQRDDRSTPLNQACLDKHLLKFASPGLGTKYYIKNSNSEYYINTAVHLPANVKCKNCVLQWHYVAGNTWGDCGNGTEALGCGPQETFRGCSDVAIN